MAREESAKLIAPIAGEEFVIFAGVPFGQSGNTNNVRAAPFHQSRGKSSYEQDCQHSRSRAPRKPVFCFPENSAFEVSLLRGARFAFELRPLGPSN